MIAALLSGFLRYTGLILILLECFQRSEPRDIAPIALGLGLVLFALLFIPVDPAYASLNFKSIMFGFSQAPNLSTNQTWLFVLAPALGAALGAYLWNFITERSRFY